MTYSLTFFSVKLVGTPNVPNSIYVYLKSFYFVLVGTTLYIMITPFYCYFWSSPQLEISKLHMQEPKDDQGVISQVELSGKATYHEHNKDVLTLQKHSSITHFAQYERLTQKHETCNHIVSL